MRETEKSIYPTKEEVLARALLSPRMRKLSKETRTEIPIPYIIQLPEDDTYLTEIDCLELNTRIKHALLRSGIKEIAQLSQVILGEQRVREIGEKSREEIKQSLEDFRQQLNEKWAENPGKPVIIEVSLPLPSEKQKKQTERQTSIVDWVKKWQAEHPGRKGALTAAAKHFVITRARVGQIITRYQRLTDESLKPEGGVSLSKIACKLGTKPKVLMKLLHQGKISFGEKIDPLYTAPESPGRIMYIIYKLKAIPISSVNKDKLKGQLAEYFSPANMMERLTTRGIAQRNKDTFIPLLKLARQANMGNSRQLSEIFDELTTAGFHLKKLSRRGGNEFYYYTHKEETEAIVSYLREKYRAEPKIRLLFGPADASIPTTTEFENQCVSVLKTVREVTGLRFHSRLTREVLKIIFQKNTPVSVFAYCSPSRQPIRTPLDSLEAFKVQVLAKKEEIIAFLEAHRHKS